MTDLATTDPWGRYPDAPEDQAELVPLASRRAFDRDLAREAAQEPRSLALIELDVDHFKNVNDTFGHAVGDKVLIRVAEALRAVVGRRGLAYRCGGEEFMALLPGFSEGEAAGVAERVRRAVEALAFGPREPTSVTASFGVAELSPDEAARAFVDRADKALYEAKKRGRNRVVAANGDYGQRQETRPPPPVALVVSDSRDLREMYTEILSNEGFEALAPLEGHEALNLVARNPVVAFVALEFEEGGVSIADFISAIKGRNPKARVYGTTTGQTSRGTPAAIADAIGRGADGIFRYPSMSLLAELIGAAIAARDGAPPPVIR